MGCIHHLIYFLSNLVEIFDPLRPAIKSKNKIGLGACLEQKPRKKGLGQKAYNKRPRSLPRTRQHLETYSFC